MSHALAYNQPCERPAPPGPIDSGLIGRDDVVAVVVFLLQKWEKSTNQQ